MKLLLAIIFLLKLCTICCGQSVESNIEEIRAKYKNVEDSLVVSKKIIIKRAFDSYPELWILLYHDSYNMDLLDQARKQLTLDATATVFYWNHKVRKIEIEVSDWPDGFSYSKEQFYFQNGKVFFYYADNRTYNYFDKNRPLVSVTEERYYLKDEQLIRQLIKEFKASANTLIKEESSKAANNVVEDGSTDNLNRGYELVELFRSNGYLNLEGY